MLTDILNEMMDETGKNVLLTTSPFTIPNTKKILNKALRSSGASIHTNELSDTVMITENHLSFIGGIEKLEERLKRYRNPVTSKKTMIEATNKEEALKLAAMDIDILQVKDFSLKDIRFVKKEIDRLNSGVALAATGKITTDNIREYARTGADILVSSYIASGSPSTIQVTVRPIFDEF
jgi:molybdenum transport protein